MGEKPIHMVYSVSHSVDSHGFALLTLTNPKSLLPEWGLTLFPCNG